jgi:hypothetical protein
MRLPGAASPKRPLLADVKEFHPVRFERKNCTSPGDSWPIGQLVSYCKCML